jgi:signal recognition particle receptor subunit beta
MIMVDSTQLASLPEARYIIDTLRSYAPVPFVMAANKQDLLDAANVEMLRSELGLEAAVPIVPCVATDQQSARGTIYVLLRMILEEMEDD